MVNVEHIASGKPVWVAKEKAIAPFKYKHVPYKMEHYIVTMGIYGTAGSPSVWDINQASGPSYRHDRIFEDEQSCIDFCNKENKDE